MAAQGNTWVGINLEQMVNAARIRLGALRLNASLELTNAGYDSDVYYGYLEEAVPDYTFSAGLPVQVLLPLSKKVVLDVSDTPQYLFYLDTERERAWNNSFQGSIHFALDEIYLQAGLESTNVRRRLSPELDVNVREKRDGLNGLALWQLSRMTSLALIYGGTEYSYTDAEFLGENISDRLEPPRGFLRFRHLRSAEPENENFRGRAIRNLQVHGYGSGQPGREELCLFRRGRVHPQNGRGPPKDGHPRDPPGWATRVSTSTNPECRTGPGSRARPMSRSNS